MNMYGNTGERPTITTNSTNPPEMRRPRRATGTWIPSAKARAYIYGLMIAASPIVIFYGLMTIAEVGLWVAFGGVALGVSNAVALANVPTKADNK